MGEVYRAIDRTTGEPVALKVMHGISDGGAQRLAREAQTLAELRHPGIVRYLAHGTNAEGTPWLAMEWLEGEDLARRLSRGALSIAESILLVKHAAEALGAAHARGFVHRDLKPSNVFLPGDDLAQVKLLDFGLVRHGGTRVTMTKTNMVIGTPGYMAPEQARGEKSLDARADVFSLGCVLFECLTGRPAFVGEHVMAVLAKVLLEEAPRARELRPDVPGALDSLIARMMAKDPNGRPIDGSAVAAALAELDELVPASEILQIRPTSLTRGEQRLLSVVLAKNRDEMLGPKDTAPTLASADVEHEIDHLRTVVKPFDARLERLADGSIVAVLSAQGAATDQAAKAARCALAIRQAMPAATLSIGTGRGQLADRWPVGEAIDRAVRLLRGRSRGQESTIRLDEVTAALLDARFEVSGDATDLLLRGERESVDTTRTVLGKPTPCVGRERELSLLVGVLEECEAEPGARAVLVTAAAGVGKSRVRYELLKKIADRPMQIWIGRGDAMSAGSPFGTIAQAIRRAAGVLDGEPLAVRRRKLRARLSRHLAGDDLVRVSEFIGELVGTSYADGNENDSVQLRAARQDAMLMGDQMRRAWEDWILAETSVGSVLLVLEDLHWGDLPSIRFVDAALRIARERPLMVVAFARPEVHEIFPKLWVDRGVLEIGLSDLTRKNGEKLVRAVLGDTIEPATIAKLVERASGNAFYLEELIRAVAAGKGDALPETVLAMVQARLEGLDADSRRVLRAASIFGDVFWRGGVSILLGGDLGSSRLSELCEREVIARLGTPKFPGDEEYSFRHALLREAAHATLTDADRTLGHGLAGKWLEERGERDAMVLAEHFERGGLHENAIVWYRRAAEQALEGNDFVAAVARADFGIRCGARDEALGGFRQLQAEAYDWHGDPSGAERCATEALTLLPRESPAWYRAVAELVTSSARLGHVDRIAPVAEELSTIALDRVATGPAVVARSRAAMQLLFAGRFELANKLFAQLEALDPDALHAHPVVAARVHQAEALRAHIMGDVGEQLRLNEASAEGFLRAGDLRGACAARVNAGFGYVEVGAFAEAERALRETLEDAERMGLVSIAAAARQNLGACLARLGRLDEARTVTELAVSTFHAQGVVRMEGGARVYSSNIHELAGDLESAERDARLAVDILVVAPPIRPCAQATLGRILLARGKSAEALSMAREAHEAMDSMAGIEEGESLVRLLLAETLEATGDHEGAKRAIAVARDRLLERAAKFASARWRQSFLENVPENARTLALAESLER